MKQNQLFREIRKWKRWENEFYLLFFYFCPGRNSFAAFKFSSETQGPAPIRQPWGFIFYDNFWNPLSVPLRVEHQRKYVDWFVLPRFSKFLSYKAVYPTAFVAYGGQGQWCGWDSFLAKILAAWQKDGQTDGRTNRQTDVPADRVTYRVAYRIQTQKMGQQCFHSRI